MGKQPMMTTTATTTTTTTSTTTTTRAPVTPSTQITSKPPHHSTQNKVERIELIDCIWNYFGCVEHKRKANSQCKVDFNDCCMLAMGMPPPTSTSTTTTTTRRPISDIDLPELPDFLRPDPTTKRPLRPIQDIDLPEGTGVIQPIEEDIQDEDQNKKEEEFFGCLGRLYACEESGRTRCPDTERCLSIEPVVSEVEVTNENGPVIGINVCKEASGGKNTDILVPHPTDCTKFFNCQSIKKYGNNWTWIAHEQNCPPTTGFDTSLKICNFIEQLPRCQRL